jgi:hypothetical protein
MVCAPFVSFRRDFVPSTPLKMGRLGASVNENFAAPHNDATGRLHHERVNTQELP